MKSLFGLTASSDFRKQTSIVSRINIKEGIKSGDNLYSKIDRHEIFALVCEVICESFGDVSSLPKLTYTVKGSPEALKLSTRMITGEMTKKLLEDVEDIDLLWAALVHSLKASDELLSYEQLAQLAPVDDGCVMAPPARAPDTTVQIQQLLGYLFSTAEQLIRRSKILASIVISDLKQIFLRSDDSRSHLSVFKAHSGLRSLAAHNVVLFPQVRAFYRIVGKELPKNSAELWFKSYPAPVFQQQPQMDDLDAATMKTTLAPFVVQRNKTFNSGMCSPRLNKTPMSIYTQSKLKSEWGRDSEDWDNAREIKMGTKKFEEHLIKRSIIENLKQEAHRRVTLAAPKVMRNKSFEFDDDGDDDYDYNDDDYVIDESVVAEEKEKNGTEKGGKNDEEEEGKGEEGDGNDDEVEDDIIETMATKMIEKALNNHYVERNHVNISTATYVEVHFCVIINI